MAQAIDDILKELDAGYNPQRQAINDQINQLQPQADQQVAGLKQQQSDAFNDITNGARDRGMGFSGIPVSEQAKYTASTFLPAVAKVQQSVLDSKNSLYSALNNVNLDQRKTAYGIQQNQQDLEEKQREFDQQLAAQKAAQAAANSGAAGLAGLFGGGGGSGYSQQPVAGSLAGGKTAANADAAVRSLINSNNAGTIVNTINAIQKSAGYGNTYDQAKLQLLQRYMPGWFTKAAGGTQGQAILNANYINRLGQAGQLKFKV